MKKRRSNSFSTLWIITALLVVLFIAALFYLQKQNNSQKQPIVNKTKSASPTKPKFDFYTILPQTKIETSSANKPAIIPSPSANPITQNNKYILQVASVKAFSDADRLKAQLTLQGFNVSIQKIQVGNTTWNRVNLGPYNTLPDAQSDQANLKKLNINSILLKIKF